LQVEDFAASQAWDNLVACRLIGLAAQVTAQTQDVGMDATSSSYIGRGVLHNVIARSSRQTYKYGTGVVISLHWSWGDTEALTPHSFKDAS
jgi:hypothetical protein